MLTRAPLLLYLSAEPFEYPRRDWPAMNRVVGPAHLLHRSGTLGCCMPPPWVVRDG
jgi:hypothetical protein